MSAQIIEKDGKPEYAVLPFSEYQNLLAIVEEKADEAAVLDFRASTKETYPASIVNALITGESPIKVFRNHRSMTQRSLANEIGKSKGYIAKLEAGGRAGSVEVLSKIAQVLGVDLDDLVDSG